jgi:lipoprotein NlpI
VIQNIKFNLARASRFLTDLLRAGYERMNMWPRAEADLLQALQLSPEQPMTLNYLGYSWVEQHRNSKQAMAYLEKAVR